MTNPASVADLESRWRPLDAQETVNGTTFLDDAWGILRRRITGIEDLVDDDPDYSAEVVRIMATAVLRVLKNPDGTKRESIDDHMWERDASISAGELYFTDEELDDLNPGSGLKGRVFMVDPLADYASRFDS